MNFYNQFIDSWNSRFPEGVKPPHLDCLKADQFNSLIDQKHALEEQSSKICGAIENLRQQMDYELFTNEYLQKCIQKLGAVSQVFSEIEQSDSKSSSSSCTNGRHPSPPGEMINNILLNQPTCTGYAYTAPNFSLLPQCIASSLINSASPLFAAVATSTTPFLFPTTLTPFHCPDPIKPDPDQLNLFQPVNSMGHAIPSIQGRQTPGFLTSPTAYNNPFGSGTNFSHILPSHSSFETTTSVPSENPYKFAGDFPTTTSEAQAAAAAVAAAFGLNFSSVHSAGSFSTPNSLMGFCTQRNLPVSSALQVSPLASTNGLDCQDTDGSGDRPFNCATCTRSFSVKAGLVQHMRTHTDERPYPCVHCGRAFKQKIQLTTHMRVHSGERPYGCRLCGKLFRQQSHVVQHLRTHTGEKPHKCYQCGKAFRQKYSLISHQRRMCRNRVLSNPIAAGMTMWISPGAGGDTGNLVKEFSPTKCNLSQACSNASLSIPISVMTSLHSPSSPSHSSVSTNANMALTPIQQPQFQNTTCLNGESHCENQLFSNRSRRHSASRRKAEAQVLNMELHHHSSSSSSCMNSEDDSLRSPQGNSQNPAPLGLT